MATGSSFTPSSTDSGEDAPFVGREGELRALQAGLERALSGRGQLFLLVGEPGIGKTRVAEELARVAAGRGARVLWGRCHEREGAPAYWPWIQALRDDLRSRDLSTARPRLNLQLAALAQFVPGIDDTAQQLPDLPPMEPEQARFFLFDSTAAFVADLARQQPLVLILDDLHWADTASLLMMEFVAQSVRDLPILMLGTYRDHDLDLRHPLVRVLASLSREASTHRLPLQGLARHDIARYISIVNSGELAEPVIDAVYRETEGNPFFVTEVVRLLASEGRLKLGPRADDWRVAVPESVREAVARQLARLPESCRQALATASVLGREFSLDVLAHLEGVTIERMLDTLDDALGARLVQARESIGSYRFSHALVQEALYQNLRLAARSRLHLQACEAIERVATAETMARQAELAYHAFRALPAGDTAQAAAYTIHAARFAMAQLAWESAAEHYQRYLQILDLRNEGSTLDRCEALLALGAAQWLAGENSAGRASYLEAGDIARALAEPTHLAQAALGHSGNDIDGLYFTDLDSERLLEEALQRLPAGDTVLRASLLCQLAKALLDDPRLVERKRMLAGEAVAMARRLDDDILLLRTLIALWWAIGQLDPDLEREAITAEFIRRAERVGRRDLIRVGHFLQASLAFERADMPTVDRAIAAFSRDWAATRHRGSLWTLACVRTMRALLEGRFADAEHHVSTFDIPQLEVAPDTDITELEYLFTLRREQGRLSEIDEQVTHFAERYEGNPEYGVFWQARLALLRLELGDVEPARHIFERLAFQDFAEVVRDAWLLNDLAALAELANLLDDTNRAAALYDLLLPFDGWNVADSVFCCYGAAAYYLGLLATTLARWDDAQRHFEDALALNARIGARPFIAHTEHRYATMLLLRDLSGDRAKAMTLLSQALASARELGMTRLADRTARLLDDVATRPASRIGSHGLSPRELEVLRHIVDGLSDREIADALFISHRTVNRHVIGILNKLGVNSRTAAATQAVRESII